jgi:methyl coenzyme M reductase alpha subunit
MASYRVAVDDCSPALGAIALIGLWAAPETGPLATEKKPAGSRPKVRLPVTAAAGTLAAFSANGLFAGLSGLFLATTLHHPSHALAGAALFLLFACGVVSQLATLQASRNSHSERFPCLRVWRCLLFPCAFPHQIWRCS